MFQLILYPSFEYKASASKLLRRIQNGNSLQRSILAMMMDEPKEDHVICICLITNLQWPPLTGKICTVFTLFETTNFSTNHTSNEKALEKTMSEISFVMYVPVCTMTEFSKIFRHMKTSMSDEMSPIFVRPIISQT